LIRGGVYYAWNFIRNDDSQKLSVEWDKAGIRQIGPNALARAPHGKPACIWYAIADQFEQPDFEHNYQRYIDHDAPIIYSSANKEQKAWAYVAPLTAPAGGVSPPPSNKQNQGSSSISSIIKNMLSRFSTSYEDASGKTSNIDVTIESSLSSANLYYVDIYTTKPDLIIGIANLPKFLGSDGFKDAVEGFKKSGFIVDIDGLVRYAGLEAAQQLLGNKSQELLANESPFLFLHGQEKGYAGIKLPPSMPLARNRSTMVILDQDHRSIAAATITLYGLTAR
jgi:hypothetical protein